MEFKCYISVDIQIKTNGIYVFEQMSGLGKTLLAKTLVRLQDNTNDVNVLVFEDTDLDDVIDAKVAIFTEKKSPLCIIDRYDFIKCDVIDKYIIDNRDSSIIFIDAKNTMILPAWDHFASLRYEEGKITVC